MVEAVECIRMRLGEPDQSGRRRPIPIEGSNFTIDCDMFVPAISQSPELEGFDELGINRWNTIDADPLTLETKVEGVFAGGDIVSGGATVISAMGAGKIAAAAMRDYVENA